jgi:hypothetical protein
MAARAFAVLAFGLALAGAASASQIVVLRGPVKPAPASAPKPETAAQALYPDAGTGLLASPMPSPGRSVGGSQCRRSCAGDLYRCRADRDEVDCNPVWMRCVLSCPEVSSDPL